jgi:hypothetical protein
MKSKFTLSAAHRKVSGYMSRSASADLPINLCYVDETRKSLVVGISDTAAIARYGGFLRQHIGDTPVVFVRCAAATRHAAKDQLNRPLVGGLQITKHVRANVEYGTLGIVAVRHGVNGFVTAGHVVGRANVKVYQPKRERDSTVPAGTVQAVSDYMTGALSDSAFVESTERLARNRIWRSADSLYEVTSAVQSLELGTELFLQGATRAEQAGVLAATDVTVRFADRGTLTEQWLANYDCQVGDSGAPVYTKDQDPNVRLVGLHVGGTRAEYVDPRPSGRYQPNRSDEFGVISPWYNIVTDLQVLR